jgi:hypothetical protein
VKHGDTTREGDEFNHDRMAYCAKCGSSHTVAYPGCDGFRGGYAGLPSLAAEAVTRDPLVIHEFGPGWRETPPAHKPSALDVQVAGGHYKGKKIQPVEYIHANGLNFLEGCIVKRITRWRDKPAENRFQDLEKIKHEVDLLIEMEKRHGKQ